MTTAYLEVRSQSAKGTWPSQGPDTYVAIQYVPKGAKRLKCLNTRAAERRGITINYIGEGYSQRRGERSSLGKAIAEATQIVSDHNTPEPSVAVS